MVCPRGGKREGAGRPRTRTGEDFRPSVRLPHEVQDIIERYADAHGMTISDVVREGLCEVVPGIKKKLS